MDPRGATPGRTGSGTHIPRIRGVPLLGSALGLFRDPLGFLLRSYLAHGPVFQLAAAGRDYVVLAGPAANLFLQRGGERYLDNRPVYRQSARQLNARAYPIATSGDWHRHLRRALQPAFSREAIDRYLPAMADLAERHVRGWQPGRRLVVIDELRRLVADELGLAMAGRTLGARLPSALTFARTAIGAGLGSYPGFAVYAPHYRVARARMLAFMREVVAAHRREPPGTARAADLVDLLLAATDLAGLPLGDDDVIANAQTAYSISMLYAAPTCAFLLYELLRRPELYEQAVAEVAALPPAEMRIETLRRAPVLHGALLESMRMNPIALATPRIVAEPFEFEGYRVPGGAQVLIAVTVCHYLPEYFPEPQRFDVQRYAPPRSEHRQEGAYCPFGLGAHACLAAGLTRALVTVTVASILRAVRLRLDPPGYVLRKVVNPFPGPARSFRLRVLEQRPAARAARSLPDEPGALLAAALPALSREQLATIAAGVRRHHYAAGTAIVRQGDPADRFFVIAAGEVEVLAAAAGAVPRAVDRLGPGAYFGEIGLLHGIPRTATVRALTDVDALTIERQDFLTLVAECDLISAEIARLVRRRTMQLQLAAALPHLTSEQIGSAMPDIERLRRGAGSTIIRAGEPADRFYILVRGAVDVVNYDPSGREIVLERLEAGDYFGEIGLLHARPRTATVRVSAEGEAELLALGRDAFLGLLDASRPTADMVAARISERLIRIDQAAGG